MDPSTRQALTTLATHGDRLGSSDRFDWPPVIRQAVHRLRYASELKGNGEGAPALVALVGGASSGKSTVFNNLLGGRAVSRITAQSHATRGLILAVHAERADDLVGRIASWSMGTAQGSGPGTEARSTEAPGTEARSTEAPGTEARSTEVPGTEARSTEVPGTEARSTEAPGMEGGSTGLQRTDTRSRGGADALLMPGLARRGAAPGEEAAGAPDVLTICPHEIDDLQGVLLFDTPDFTSEAARREGDLLRSSLPWFDRLIIVIDRERWFDRQSLSELRRHADPFGAPRMVVFNCTEPMELTDADRHQLAAQAERLGAENMAVLEHRLGRGLCLFPPGALDEVRAFLGASPPDRQRPVLRAVAGAAQHVLNQNGERRHRLERLRETLGGALRRELPSARACMVALMNAEERKNLDVVSRVLRLHETRAWLGAQSRRIGAGLRKVPLVGAMLGGSAPAEAQARERGDRAGIAEAHFESTARRHVRELNRLLEASLFWDEVRKWTGTGPESHTFEWTPALRDEVRADAVAFDRAMAAWIEKVAGACAGVAPNVKGAIGAGALGVAVVLIAVPGPLGVLTVAAAQSALAAAAGKLAIATGAGALFGKQATRLADVVTEKVVGSTELRALESAAERYRARIESEAQTHVDAALREAEHLTLPKGDSIERALERVCAEGGANG